MHAAGRDESGRVRSFALSAHRMLNRSVAERRSARHHAFREGQVDGGGLTATGDLSDMFTLRLIAQSVGQPIDILDPQ